MVDKDVVSLARSYLSSLRSNGLDVSFGILFGSYATDQAGPWSDIDLLVVSRQFDGVVQRPDIDFLWEMTLDADERIEPIPCGLVEWSVGDRRAIVEIARREGHRIELDQVG